MNSKNVIALPASTNFNAEQALNSALKFDNMSDVLIVGYSADESFVVRSSRMTRAEALFLLEKAKAWALDGSNA